MKKRRTKERKRERGGKSKREKK
jgi:hypothetical protein